MEFKINDVHGSVIVTNDFALCVAGNTKHNQTHIYLCICFKYSHMIKSY